MHGNKSTSCTRCYFVHGCCKSILTCNNHGTPIQASLLHLSIRSLTKQGVIKRTISTSLGIGGSIGLSKRAMFTADDGFIAFENTSSVPKHENPKNDFSRYSADITGKIPFVCHITQFRG